MERVAFLIESTGVRIGCLLNPETVVVRRWAGIRPRRSLASTLRADALADDPVLFTGGGTTELELELLFDVGIAGSTAPSSPDGEASASAGDVRDLTLPLWRLAETGEVSAGELRPSIVRFLWGKTWNVLAVVAAVAERFEAFGPDGAPRRSWMRMRLLRVPDPAPRQPASSVGMETLPEPLETHQVLGAGAAPDGEGGSAAPSGDRLDELAQRYFGDPGAWKQIAELNDVDDPLHLPPGAALRIPTKEGP